MNPIPINCVCGKRFKVNPELRGKITRCPRCGSKHIIPKIYKDIPEVLNLKVPNKAWLLFGPSRLAKTSIFSFFLAALVFGSYTTLKVLEINLVQDIAFLGATFLFLALTFILGLIALRLKQNRSRVLAWVLTVTLLLAPVIALETLYTLNREGEKTQKAEKPEKIIPLDLSEDWEEEF